MKQLVQLRKLYPQFKAAETEIIAIFREDKLGVKGLKLSRKKTKASFPFLLDYQKEEN